jgi:prepilin-type N-terminal cleavage/methylation domain-containing protein
MGNQTEGRGNRNSGFTLIELMIVVAIIGVLAAIAIPKFGDLIQKSRDSSVQGDLGALRSAISIYYADTEGLFPSDHLTCLTTGARYLDSIPTPKVGNHAKGTSVFTNDSGGLNAIFTVDNGEWVYWNWTISNTFNGVTGTQGKSWVGCTHADAKGIQWSTR